MLFKAAIALLLLSFTTISANAQLGLPPTITAQPSDRAVSNGGTATFQVEAYSLLGVSYRWFHNGVEIAGATQNSYTINNADCEASGKYFVEIRNLIGVVTSRTVTLTILGDCVSTDNVTSSKTSGGGETSLTWSHVISGGSAGLLLVSVSSLKEIAVSSVTFGGKLLTKAGATVNSTGPGARAEIWYLKSPPAGAANVVVTMNKNAPFTAGAINFFGVNQTVTFGSFVSATGTGDKPKISLTSASGELVVDAVAAHSAISGSTGANQTEQWRKYTGNGGSDVWGSSSVALGTPALTMSWNLSGSGAGEWAAAAVSIKPFSFAQLADVTAAISGPDIAATTSNVTYQISVGNLGPGTASNLVVSDILPLGAEFVHASSGGSLSNGVVIWPNISALNSGAQTNLTVTLKSPTAGAWTNAVSCTASTPDSNSANNDGSDPAANALTAFYDPPVIIQQPHSRVVCAGEEVTLSVVAAGTAPFEYQWFFNGSPLNCGTNATLNITNISRATAGAYSVIVSNKVAVTASSSATLVVTNPPSTISLSDTSGMTPDGFKFQFSLPIGATYVVEASENCQTWGPIFTNVALSGVVTFTDGQAVMQPQRFYRIVIR